VAADIGCHSFATLPPFNMGNSILGYGLGLSSAAAVAPALARRTVTVMRDGGFWHNGLASGVTGALQTGQDGVLVVLDNGYTSATGQQWLPSSRAGGARKPTISIEGALRAMGVRWVRTMGTYDVGRMVRVLRRALTTKGPGLKVIVAAQECQLARQRRLRPLVKRALGEGKRVVRTRFGVDVATCTGDHSCIRLSGCPSLSLRKLDDPLRDDPVASIDQSCVGCGNCGEVADAAVLCPSFYRADVVHNPSPREARWAAVRARVIGWLQRRREARRLTFGAAA